MGSVAIHLRPAATEGGFALIRVVLADDDYMVLEELRTLVDWTRLGFTIVAMARNGEQAYKRFAEFDAQLVISDVNMPGTDGLDLLARIREQDSHAFVLMISSYADFHYAKRALRAGAFDYIMKEELTAELLEEKLRDIAARICTSRWSENRIVRTLLSDFCFCTETADVFLRHNVDGDALTQNIRRHLYQRRFYFYFAFRTVLSHKPQRANPYTGNGRALWEALTGMGKQAPSAAVMFYLERGVVIGVEPHGKAPLTEPVQLGKGIAARLEEATGRRVVGFTTGKLERLAAFRDCLFQSLKTLYFSMVFADSAMVDLSAVPPPLILNRLAPFDYSLIEKSWSSPQIYFDRLHEYLSQLFQARDIDRLTGVYQNILDHYERLGLSMDPDEARYFDTLQELEAFLRAGYEKAMEAAQSDHRKTYSTAVQKMIRLIEKEFMDPDLSVDRIAGHVGLSAGRVSVLFRKETGKTINDYLTEVRMEHAVYLLTNTNMKIYEIANSCGYRSAQYFSKVFNSKSGKRLVDYK